MIRVEFRAEPGCSDIPGTHDEELEMGTKQADVLGGRLVSRQAPTPAV